MRTATNGWNQYKGGTNRNNSSSTDHHADTGKTLSFQVLLQIDFGIEKGIIFQPTDQSSRFSLEGLTKEIQLCYMDEFSGDEVNPKTLNKLLAGEPVKVDEKCKAPRAIVWKGPVIITGNDPDVFKNNQLQKEAFLARLRVVHADTPLSR